MRVWRPLKGIKGIYYGKEARVLVKYDEYDEYDIYYFFHKNLFGYGNCIGNFKSKNYK